jgi:hypothetical protein
LRRACGEASFSRFSKWHLISGDARILFTPENGEQRRSGVRREEIADCDEPIGLKCLLECALGGRSLIRYDLQVRRSGIGMI